MVDQKFLIEAEGGDPEDKDESTESTDEEIVSGQLRLRAATRSESVCHNKSVQSESRIRSVKKLLLKGA